LPKCHCKSSSYCTEYLSFSMFSTKVIIIIHVSPIVVNNEKSIYRKKYCSMKSMKGHFFGMCFIRRTDMSACETPQRDGQFYYLKAILAIPNY
jgi:hypothetical protein